MSALTASPELQRLVIRQLAAKPDLELVAGYMSGEIATCPGRSRWAAVRFQGRFTRPSYQRSPDRERSIHRRRQLAATWPMPPVMAGHITTSQVAYARIVADEVHRTGDCRLTLDEIAARGGMSRKTAKRAQDRLGNGNSSGTIEGLKWITVEERPIDGRKHLPNVVRIVSPEWMTWIKMGPKPRPIGGHSRPPRQTSSLLRVRLCVGRGPKGLSEEGSTNRGGSMGTHLDEEDDGNDTRSLQFEFRGQNPRRFRAVAK